MPISFSSSPQFGCTRPPQFGGQGSLNLNYYVPKNPAVDGKPLPDHLRVKLALKGDEAVDTFSPRGKKILQHELKERWHHPGHIKKSKRT